jgi:ornithine decarboxylase
MDYTIRRTRLAAPRPELELGQASTPSVSTGLDLQAAYNATSPSADFSLGNALSPDVFGSGLMRFSSIEDMVKTLRPEQSVMCFLPDNLIRAAKTFVDYFPGASLYAVKSNPDPYVLQHLHAAGIRHFDVASLNEVKLIRGLFPDAHLAFMHPIKSRQAIRSAYFDYGVRDFVIDTFEEMHKILEETQVAADLTIIVRIAMPKGSAACPLAGKFGCTPEVGIQLLGDAAKVAHKVGLSFHVGSQSLDPSSYADAIRKAGEIVQASGVVLDVLDIGGGFPIPDLGMDVLPLTTYFDVIRTEIAKLNLPEACQIWSEPGRALSGTGAALVVRVELRKGDVLYINDGSFGNMFEVASMSWKNTSQLIRPARKGRKASSKTVVPFRFYGPTCDSVDYMPGPFALPDDICEGDWIVLHGMGSYTAASRSSFNGFYSDMQVEIAAPATVATAPQRRRAPRSANLKLVKSDRAGA